MASKYLPLRIIFILLLFCLIAFRATAQTTLPDIAAAADKGIVILSWNCQYNGIRSITVLRSADSLYNYSVIGKVKKLDKGVQAFVDGHPAAGKNFYKLIILFNSGLNWSSNHCGVTVEQSVIETSHLHLPPNDSLQRYIATIDTVKAGKINTATEPVTKLTAKSVLDIDANEDTEEKPKTKTLIDEPDDTDMAISKPAEPSHRIYISFDPDSVLAEVAPSPDTTKKKEEHRQRIIISFDDPGTSVPTIIKSQYIFTDPATGHVDMNLPDDVTTHHYSVKFYNADNQMIIEIPRINASKIIIDKRNFQQKGTYKFILRKDVTELESGYVIIN